MRILCSWVGHSRAKRGVRINRQTAHWESQCKFCGVPMVRLAHRQWALAPQAPEQQQEGLGS